MPDYFESARLKLARAKKYATDLKTERDRFINDHPWTSTVEIDPGRFIKEFKIKFTRDIPKIFGDLTSNALQNLRAALDHATNAAARASGVESPRDAYFPFGTTEHGLEIQIKGRCKNVPPDIVAIIRAFRPYHTGNPIFWFLNHAANIDKHGVGLSIGGGLDAVVFRGPGAGSRPLRLVAPRFDSRKNEIVYAVCHPEADPHYDFHLMVDVAFGEVDIVGGQPVSRVLDYLLREVESVLVTIERETRRLFPIAF